CLVLNFLVSCACTRFSEGTLCFLFWWPLQASSQMKLNQERLALVSLSLLLATSSAAQATAPISINDDTPAGSTIVDLRSVLTNNQIADSADLKILNHQDPIVNCLAINGTVLYATRLVDRDSLCREPLIQRYVKPCCLDSEPCELWLQLSHKAAQSNVLIPKLRLRLLDSNDNAPTFRRASLQVEVQEGERGRRISSPDFLAADPDQGDNSRLTYRLESDDDEFSFALENSNRRPVVLKTNRALDREKTDSYSLRLLAVDNGRPQRTGTLSITVLVLDINDETPVFEKSLYVASVPENAPKNTPVVTVRAVDGDQGANGRVSYRISPGEYANHFDVSNQPDGSGLVKLKYQLDADQLVHRGGKIDLYVGAMDHGSPQRSAEEARIEVTVSNVNDERPEIEVIPLSSGVPENSPDIPVARVEVKDRDSHLSSLSCRVEDPEGGGGGGFVLRDDLSSALPSGNFAGHQSRGFVLRSERPLNRELRSTVQLIIVCLDGGGLNGTAVVRFRVSDRNDNPPRFQKPVFQFHLPENTPPPENYRIGIIKANDKDEGENARIAYSLEPSADADAFHLDAQTGQLFAGGHGTARSCCAGRRRDRPANEGWLR
ncbi:hypothetical protein BOX15_Mlig014758g1, partial [Macrostomum lignano]